MVRMDEEKKPKNRTRGYLLKGDSQESLLYAHWIKSRLQ